MEFIEQNVSALAEKFSTTPEVITKFLTDASAAEEVKPLHELLSTAQVYRPDELTTRINNERRQAAEEAERTTKGNMFDMLDKRIKGLTNVDKEPEESRDSLAYAERAFKKAFGAKPKADESEEVRTLRQDLAAAKELLSTKETALQQASTKLESMEVEYATKLQQQQFNGQLDGAINSLSIDVDSKLLPGQRKLLKVEFDERYEVKMQDSRRIITDRVTGKEMRDDKTAEPMTVEQVVALFAPQVVSLKSVQKRGTGVNDAGKKTPQDTKDFAAYPTLDAYKKTLTDSGITLVSQQGQDLIAEYQKYRDSK